MYPNQDAYGPYTLLTEPKLTEELARLSFAKSDGKTDSVSFQPCPDPEERSQDRHVIKDLSLQDGSWSIRAIFDGHGGHEVADYLVQALVPDVEKRLREAGLEALSSVDKVSTILSESVKAVDDKILHDVLELFPSVEYLSKLTVEDVRNIVNDDGPNLLKMHRCMRGSTALVALLDPPKKNLWVASLGDCQAVLGWKTPTGSYDCRIMSSNHNGADPKEAKRVRDDHPGEDECVLDNRVIGSIAVTRAIGDFLFKLPREYTEKVFVNVDPGFRFSRPLNSFLARNLTPPYLSNVADVQHAELQGHETVLILCSDGLTDLYHDQMNDTRLAELGKKWVELVAGSVVGAGHGNLGVILLRDAIGGEDLDKSSRLITAEYESKWMDDVTIVVDRLGGGGH